LPSCGPRARFDACGVNEPEIQEKFRTIGFEPTGQDVNAFAAYHTAEVKRWTAFVSEIGLHK